MTLAIVPDDEDPRDESERDYEAAVLDAHGLSARDIAAQMGYPTRFEASAAVQRGQLAASRVTAEEVRARHLVLIRSLQKAAMATVENPGPMVDRGGTVLTDEEGYAIPDENARMNAVDKASRLMERESKLVGADAPTKNVNVGMNLDAAQMREFLLGKGITPAQIDAATRALMAGQQKALPAGEVHGG